jgi:hypothetical protein
MGEPRATSAVFTITYDAFGIEEGEFERLTHRIRQGETFAAILARYEVPYTDVVALTQAARGVFNIRQLQAGRPLHVYRDSTGAQVFVYQPDPVRFVVFDRRAPVYVYTGRRAVERVPRQVHGIIRGSLYETLQAAGALWPSTKKLASMVSLWALNGFWLLVFSIREKIFMRFVLNKQAA